MGVQDSFEQLQAAKAECVRLERELAAAHAVIEKARERSRKDIADQRFIWAENDTARQVIDCFEVYAGQSPLASVDTSALAERDAATLRAAANHITHDNIRRALFARADALTENGADS